MIHPLPARIKETVRLDQLADAVKSNLGFKLFGVDQINAFSLSKVIKKASPL
jgi:hypothetical protein